MTTTQPTNESGTMSKTRKFNEGDQVKVNDGRFSFVGKIVICYNWNSLVEDFKYRVRCEDGNRGDFIESILESV